MSDARDRSGGPPIDSDAFQEWIEHTAATRGIDEQELLNQLVSAFWLLDEMNGISDGGDVMEGVTALYPPNASNPDQGASGRDTALEDLVAQSDAADDAERREPDDRKTTDPEDPNRNDTQTDESAEEAASDSVADEIRALRESMYGQIEMIQTVAELRRQVSDLSLDVEQQRSRQDQFTDRISDTLTRLHSRVESLDEQVEEAGGVDEAELDRLSEEISAEIDRIESTQREFESWVDGEFDDIEALFRDILETTDAFEERLDALDDELAALREKNAVDDRLAAVRSEAIALGTDTARCDQCGSAVDLSMLDEAVCPTCESTFDGVREADGWNPFAKPVLDVTDDRFDAE